MVIQVEIYFVTSATLNGIWCIVTVSDLQQQQQTNDSVTNSTLILGNYLQHLTNKYACLLGCYLEIGQK